MSTSGTPGGPPDQPQQQQPQAPPAPPAAPPVGQPGGAIAASGPGGAGGIETRDSTTVWLLCALVPFYALYHFHRVNKELVAWSGGKIDYNATSSLLALTIGGMVIIPPFIALSSFTGRVRHAQQLAGVEQQASFGGFFLRLLLFSYGWKWLQDQLNELAVRQPQG
jgi:hypothetical protein